MALTVVRLGCCRRVGEPTMTDRKTFEILPTAQGYSIKCLLCQRISSNPNDVENHYCGACHIFHDEYALKVAMVRSEAERL